MARQGKAQTMSTTFLMATQVDSFSEAVPEKLGTVHGLYTAPPLYRKKSGISSPLTAEDIGLADVISAAC